MFSPVSRSSARICGRQAFLNGLAMRAGIDFLAQEFERLPGLAVRETDRFPKGAPPRPPITADAADRPESSPYWGING